MVSIILKYTEEELAPKNQKFYCGSGLVKCKVTSTEKGASRYSTAEKPKPEVLKIHYTVADGEYLGAENTIEFDLWTEELFDGG